MIATVDLSRLVSLPAGRELDCAVAEHVFGCTVCDRGTAVRMSNAANLLHPIGEVDGQTIYPQPWDDWYTDDNYLQDTLGFAGMSAVPGYSTDIAEAWQVHKLERIYSTRRRYLEALREVVSRRVLANPDRDIVAIEEVAHLMEPVDICLAALKAKLSEGR